MARADYDATCDIIDGPGTATPGNIRHSNVPCRVVADLIVFQREKWLEQDVAYVTMDESDVHAIIQAAGPPGPQVLEDECDRLAIPSGVAANHTVLWTERVTPDPSTTYYRAHVRMSP